MRQSTSRRNQWCRTIVDMTKVQSYPSLCQIMGMLMQSLNNILNKEDHRYRLVKIKSLAMSISLDSKEVCIKLDNCLSKIIASSICISNRKFRLVKLQNIPGRTNMASIISDSFSHRSSSVSLKGKDHWMTIGSATTGSIKQ